MTQAERFMLGFCFGSCLVRIVWDLISPFIVNRKERKIPLDNNEKRVKIP